MKILRVTTQDELDVALATPAPHEIWICGTGRFVLRENAQHFVRATDKAHVEAWGSSHVVAWESSHVVARESSHVVAWESSHVEASQYVSVTKRARDSLVSISGGVLIEIPALTTAEAWLDYYGVPIVDGVATLFKAVRQSYGSHFHDAFKYLPGSTPAAPDWHPVPECGNGLHFSPAPFMALEFYSLEEEPRFIACPLRVEEIVVHPDGTYLNKVKAPRVALPCYEVDRYGAPLVPQAVAS